MPSILHGASEAFGFTPGQYSVLRGGSLCVEAVYERHTTIKRFFMDVLNVSEETAEQDACKIEHILSEESYEKLKNFKK